MTIHSGITPNVPITPGGPVEVDNLQSANAGGTVTVEQFYDALFQEDASTLNSWIEQDLIPESVLRSLEPRTKEPLLVYLIKNPKINIQDQVTALIYKVPQELIDAPGKDGQTPLLLLSKRPQSSGMMDALLKRGANPNVSDKDGCTVLMHCIKNSYSSDMVRYLCRHGVHLNAKDVEGRTALHHVALMQNCALVPELVGAGADKTSTDVYGKTALAIAKEQSLDGDDPVQCALQVSQADMLAYLGSIFGDAFRADLLKASTLTWEAIADTLSYALSLLPGSANAIVETDVQAGERSYNQRELDNEPIEDVVVGANQPVYSASGETVTDKSASATRIK
ncbi:ankyrin repeat domain-containing protein [Bordetella muralis]|jgi:hypothetical protein|uniref:ankyrin repeat domain-containing protein n=1 Tax=Bordetella muralis TaxID=1649130 RepID=UPI0039F0B7C2